MRERAASWRTAVAGLPETPDCLQRPEPVEGALQDFEYSDPSGSNHGTLSPETFRSADDSFDERHDEGKAACSAHEADCNACTFSSVKSNCLQYS